VEPTAQSLQPTKAQLWTGRVLSTLAILFLTFDATIKLLRLPMVEEASAKLGYQAPTIFHIGMVLLVCVILYAIPQTSVLGAVLLTGYLGGAVATHTRVGDPLFSHILFPTYVGALLWLGLYLREPRLRALVPFRS
jgi:DoxX-like family